MVLRITIVGHRQKPQPTPTHHTHTHNTTTSAITKISWSCVISGLNRMSSVFCVLFHLYLRVSLLRIVQLLCLGSCLDLCALKSAQRTAWVSAWCCILSEQNENQHEPLTARNRKPFQHLMQENKTTEDVLHLFLILQSIFRLLYILTSSVYTVRKLGHFVATDKTVCTVPFQTFFQSFKSFLMK